MLKNLTIKTRLVFVLSFLALQLILGAALGLISLKIANDDNHIAVQDGMTAMGALDIVARKLIRVQTSVALAITGSPDEVKKLTDGITENMTTLDTAWTKYRAIPMSAEEKQMGDDFAAARSRFEKEGLLPAAESLKQGDIAGATKIVQAKMLPLYDPLKVMMDKLLEKQREDAADMDQAALHRYEMVKLTCIIGIVIGLLTAVGMGVWLIRSIVHPINRAVDAANKVAAGDLTVQVESTTNDETGKLLKALQTMTNSLAKIVTDVRGGTDLLTTAAAEIAVGNQDLSSRTEQQAASLEETASSMEELTATVKQNADNAERANRLATSATETARQGGKAVADVVRTMEQINQSAHQIETITGVIDSIAFQTNLLALNAAVEAARAGEQGRGFAVVATEVRALAKRSADAAKEIKELITVSTAQVEDGARQVHKAGETMSNIVHGISQVNDIVSEISAASYEQSSGIELVNKAIVEMDHVTQQNAALVEEAAAGATSMQEEALRLSQAVAVFKLA